MEQANTLPEVYYTDGYPREGCKIEIVVVDGVFKMRIYPPGRDKWIESYAGVSDPEDIGRMVKEWCEGKAPTLKERAI